MRILTPEERKQWWLTWQKHTDLTGKYRTINDLPCQEYEVIIQSILYWIGRIEDKLELLPNDIKVKVVDDLNLGLNVMKQEIGKLRVAGMDRRNIEAALAEFLSIIRS